jgi:hypothetical protein
VYVPQKKKHRRKKSVKKSVLNTSDGGLQHLLARPAKVSFWSFQLKEKVEASMQELYWGRSTAGAHTIRTPKHRWE